MGLHHIKKVDRSHMRTCSTTPTITKLVDQLQQSGVGMQLDVDLEGNNAILSFQGFSNIHGVMGKRMEVTPSSLDMSTDLLSRVTTLTMEVYKELEDKQDKFKLADRPEQPGSNMPRPAGSVCHGSWFTRLA